MKEKTHISVVSPVYKAENIIKELVRRLKENLDKITDSYEIILVNDSSPDNSWEAIEKECNNDDKIVGVNLSRNFGQQYAITAGINISKGDWVVIMDCDLQDKPEEIINLYKKALEGYDSVFAKRINRNDSLFKKLFSKIFYSVFSYLTDTKQDSSVANFGIFNRKVIEAVLSMKDYIRYLSAMIQWVGFKIYYLPVEHSERYEGKTSYNIKGLFKLAFDTIIAFSYKPLRLIILFGFFIVLSSFIIGIYYFINYFLGNIPVMGFTTIILFLCFLSGIIISVLGIIGLYVGKIFESVKNRPTYIIKDIVNTNNDI
ncbi:MAG: glycosyltransferase [Treponema sp.]|nr:glycosyltransferase [Treponema sp.]